TLWPDAVLMMSRDSRLAQIDDAALPGIFARTNAFAQLPAKNYTTQELAAAAPAWQLESGMPTKFAVEAGPLTARERVAPAVAWVEAARAYEKPAQPWSKSVPLGDRYTPEQEQMFRDRFEQLRSKPVSAIVQDLNDKSAIRPVLNMLYPNVKYRNELAV